MKGYDTLYEVVPEVFTYQQLSCPQCLLAVHRSPCPLSVQLGGQESFFWLKWMFSGLPSLFVQSLILCVSPRMRE